MIVGKRLMILGASRFQLPEILNAKRLGCIVYAIDQDKDAIGFRYANQGYPISTMDIPGILELAKTLKIDGIMTLSDQPMISVATVGTLLNLSTISSEAAIKATNKAKMRQALKEYNVPIPKFYVVKTFEEYLGACSQFKMPFIVKPADNSGSRGIFLVQEESEKERGFWYSVAYSRSQEVLIEEFMVGDEVSVETLAVDGVTHIIAVTDKITTGPPYFVEMGHVIPTRWKDSLLERIKEVTLLAHKALGIDKGPTHTEIKITDEGPKIIEVGARLGGDHITGDLVPLATGVNMIEACIYLALGEAYEFPRLNQDGAAIRFLPTQKGKIKGIKGLDVVKSLKGVEKVYCYKEIGEEVEGTKSSDDRGVGVVVKAKDALEANKICEEAISKLQIIYE